MKKNMLNQTVIVGRIVNIESEKETNKGMVTLAVPRSYKNTEGEYDTDFIPCVLYNGIAQNVLEYCKVGDLVGIKGRIQTREIEQEDDVIKFVEVVAEKVTFLSTSSRKEEDGE